MPAVVFLTRLPNNVLMPVKTRERKALNSALDVVRAAARQISQDLLNTGSQVQHSELYISTCTILAYMVSNQLLTDSQEQKQAALLFSKNHGAEFSHLPTIEDDLPADWLAHVYEHLLCYQVDNGQLHEQQGKSKKRSGSFYTPIELAQFAVEQALQAQFPASEKCAPSLVLERFSQLKLVDPAMGGGTFLCAALSQLAEILRCASQSDRQGPIADDADAMRATIAKCNLYGVDIDPGCVQIARLTIAGMCGRFAEEVFLQLDNNLKCGDALLGLCKSPRVCGPRDGASSASGADEDAGATRNRGSGRSRSDSAAHSHCKLTPKSPAFNWHSDFAPIFARPQAGFDIVVGNPPWEIHKPNSREFFQEHIENYWQLSKQDALAAQENLAVEDELILEQWAEHEGDYKRLSQFFTSGEVYKLQSGADLNAYKLFVELAHQIAGQSGVVSLLIPTGICTDKGSGLLRKTLLQNCSWKSVHGFQNGQGIFNIHRSFKFCLLTFQNGSSTDAVQINMGNDTVARAQKTESISCPRSTIEAFSPANFSLLDVASRRDLQLLEKICSHAVTVDSFLEKREFRFAREFDMTLDSHKFLPREKMEGLGYRADIYGHWIAGDWQPAKEKKGRPAIEIFSRDGQFVLHADDIGAVAYPLYEGRMIDQFDDCSKGWVSGKGRRAIWRKRDHLEPQYLLPANLMTNRESLKVGYLAVGSPTNARSMIAACLAAFPCGNSVPVLTNRSLKESLLLVALLNSFVFDYVLRSKMSGNNINLFLLKECFLPEQLSHADEEILAAVAAALSFTHSRHAPSLLALRCTNSTNPSSAIAFSQGEHEPSVRSGLRAALDAYVARLYGLDDKDFAHILTDCSNCSQAATSRGNIKGFWRFEKNLPAHDRIAVRALDAFNRMQSEQPRTILQNALNGLNPVQQPVSEDLSRHSDCLSAIRAH